MVVDEIKKYCFLLEKNHDLRWKHYVFELGNLLSTQGSEILFSSGASLLYLELSFYTNYPEENKPFERYKFRKINFKYKPSDGPFYLNDPIQNQCVKLKADIPGAYTFYVTDASQVLIQEVIEPILKFAQRMPESILCMGYFVVDPKIRSIEFRKIKIDQLSIQTVISKCLGPLNEWKQRLLHSQILGYNAIHFTPFQKYGNSRSCYSINDHLHFDRSIADGKISDHFPAVSKYLKSMFNCVIVDLVLNHTSNDSPVVRSHPESYYNLENSPHLRPAFLVDRALYYLSELLLKYNGRIGRIASLSDLKNIETFLRNDLLPTLRLVEFYVIDVERTITKFREFINSVTPTSLVKCEHSNVEIIQDSQFRRLNSSIDFEAAYNKFFHKTGENQHINIEERLNCLREHLRHLNQTKSAQIQEVQNEIISNVYSNLHFHFLDPHGPMRKSFSINDPLLTNYFTICIDNYSVSNLNSDEALMDTESCKFIIANQGWVMGGNVVDFVSPSSQVYLRRQLIAWGDCAKIRWGSKKEDSPFIWSYFEKHIDSLIHNVDGFRLDNCHSTPIPVLEHLVDYCRNINPNLILIGELFTNSESEDNLFVNRVGLTYLVRERMSGGNLASLCHIVHRFAGRPIGSIINENQQIRIARPTVARAILTDMTHDNDCLYTKYSPLDYLPSAAFITMANCSLGSVRGYDEMVPYQINVVSESRLYSTLESSIVADNNLATIKASMKRAHDNGKESIHQGILNMRIFLNNFNLKLENEGYDQIYIDQLTDQIVTVTRFSPKNCTSYVFISHHAFNHNESEICSRYHEANVPDFPLPLSTDWQHPEIRVPGLISEIVIEAYSGYIGGDKNDQNSKYILGSEEYFVISQQNISLIHSKMAYFRIENEFDPTKITSYVALPRFPPGSIMICKVDLHPEAKNSIKRIEFEFTVYFRERISNWRELLLNTKIQQSHLNRILDQLTFSDINHILFKCEAEAKDDYIFTDYHLPDYGEFIYKGLYGVQICLNSIRENNDLGHPLCRNLRNGHWLLDHLFGRLENYYSTRSLSQILKEAFDDCKIVPYYLLPCYFELVVRYFNELIINWVFRKCNSEMLKKDRFSQKLILSTFALIGNLRNIKPPKIDLNSIETIPKHIDPEITISAGLPHFSTSWYRTWGRDILISLNGLLLLSGRTLEAKIAILSIASTVRHGLVPNLISSLGANPRYNSRDATWFFLNSLREYCLKMMDYNILNANISPIFENDDSEACFVQDKTLSLAYVVQVILEKHYQGIDFIERNSGSKLDSNMKEEGFHIVCGIDHATGFVYGGNRWNCGTWMDKMGSSKRANNAGFPATPRDGCAIELVAISYRFLTWIMSLYEKKLYPYSGIKGDQNHLVTWRELTENIKNNFEKLFWIPLDPQEAKEKFPNNTNLINRYGIYKDTYGSSLKFTDFQFRPNFLIAMSIAPDLFEERHAACALENAHKILEGRYGMKTLDPSDWCYNGFYNNSQDNEDYNSSQGFNYHNGPEWLWISGCYMKSLIYFLNENEKLFSSILKSMLCRLFSLETNNQWLGLPELTQKDGQYCHDSCDIQSWSVACVLEVIHDYYEKYIN